MANGQFLFQCSSRFFHGASSIHSNQKFPLKLSRILFVQIFTEKLIKLKFLVNFCIKEVALSLLAYMYILSCSCLSYFHVSLFYSLCFLRKRKKKNHKFSLIRHILHITHVTQQQRHKNKLVEMQSRKLKLHVNMWHFFFFFFVCM